MFRLIIADDEMRSREGFSRIVNWETLGFKVVGCYSDGVQVLEHLAREHVDVVLTDIKMQHISGLEVAQKIHDCYPNTICVLVSAYQEFEFAHMSIAAGVKDYLFKPTRLSDIRRVFSSIAHELEHESEIMEQQASKSRQYEEMSQLWRSQFLYDLYMGTIKGEDIIDQQAHHHYPKFENCAAILWQIKIIVPHGDEGVCSDDHYDMLHRLFQGELNGATYDPVNIEQEMIDVLSVVDSKEQHALIPQLEERLQELILQAQEMGGVNMAIQSRQCFETLQALCKRPRSYLRFIGEGERAQLEAGSVQLLLQQQRLLLSYISAGNAEQAITLTQEMAEHFIRLSPAMARTLMIDTVARVQAKLQELQLAAPVLPRYDLLLTAQDEKSMCCWMNQQVEYWLNQRSSTIGTDEVIRQIKNYVRSAAFSGNVSLDSVAEHVFLSPVYVSRLFKQETGENFSDFVTHIRIDAACHLLVQSNMLVSEVGQRVGYPNPRYFYRVFKNATGLTPSEYRHRNFKEGKYEPDTPFVEE